MSALRNTVIFFALTLMGCGTPTNSGLGGGPFVSDDSGAGSSGASCNTVCSAQARASCANFSMGQCVSRCQAQLSAAPACAASLDATARCANTATFTCDPAGAPTTGMCTSELLAYVGCVSAATRDGGA